MGGCQGSPPRRTHLGFGLHGVVLGLHPLLGVLVHTGVPDPAEQGGCLLQQPVQEHGLAVRVAQQHLRVAQLPLLLLQAQLQLHGRLQGHRHLLEPAAELLLGQEVLSPVQPHPLDAAVDTETAGLLGRGAGLL